MRPGQIVKQKWFHHSDEYPGTYTDALFIVQRIIGRDEGEFVVVKPLNDLAKRFLEEVPHEGFQEGGFNIKFFEPINGIEQAETKLKYLLFR